jgi:hypothetical protein
MLSTNQLGFREDAELATPPADLRVLIAGDSHTFGLCNNGESFPNLLERDLRSRLGGKSVEVLNAGVGAFTLFNYFGTLLRESEFMPQVFVVAVYGGNDFAELLMLGHRFASTPISSWPEGALKRRTRGLAAGANAMGQCLNQVQTFLSMPDEQEFAVGTAVRLCSEMQQVCNERRIRMIVVFIPAACVCTFADPLPEMERAREALGLGPGPDESGINSSLAERFLSGVRALGLELVDMTEPFKLQNPPPYWRTDLHLNLEGHRLIAEQLEPLILRSVKRK